MGVCHLQGPMVLIYFESRGKRIETLHGRLLVIHVLLFVLTTRLDP